GVESVRPGCAGVDPRSNGGELCRIERLAAHWHARLIADADHAPVEQTLGGFARLDDRARLSAGERQLLRIEAEAAHLQFFAVAGVTRFFEDGLDVIDEIGGRGRQNYGYRD